MDVVANRDRDARRRAPAALVRAGLVCGSVLLIAATVWLVGRVLVRVAPVTLAVVAALLLAALLTPLVDRLTRLRLPRGVAALTAILALLAALVLPLVLVGSQVAKQFGDLGGRLDEGVAEVRNWIVTALPVSEQQLDRMWEQTRTAALDAVPTAATGASVATEVLGAAVLALFLLFFLLKDGPAMWRWLLRWLPGRRRERADRAGAAGWDALSGYVRGTVVVAAVDAVGIGAALLLVGVPLALPLALLTFIAAFIPIVGATVAGAAAVLVALIANGPTDALIILAAVIAVQQAEGNLLEPLVMGRAVRLHPAVILVAVAAGTILAGVAGAIVAVPLAAVTYRVFSVLSGHEDARRQVTDPGGHPPPPGERPDRGTPDRGTPDRSASGAPDGPPSGGPAPAPAVGADRH